MDRRKDVAIPAMLRQMRLEAGASGLPRFYKDEFESVRNNHECARLTFEVVVKSLDIFRVEFGNEGPRLGVIIVLPPRGGGM